MQSITPSNDAQEAPPACEIELAQARAMIHTLQNELVETNRGLVALMLELEQRVDERTAELRATQQELQRTNSELLQLTLELEDRVAERTRDLRESEERFRTLNATLEQHVAERTAELAAKNRELETFTYSVSHDLKAPLRGIDGYSKLLLEDHLESLNEDGCFFLHAIRRGIGQMNELIDDLLAYSRLERRALQPNALNLRTTIERLVAERGDELRANRVSLRIDLPDGSVLADVEGFAQVIRNLLDNALKFTKVLDPYIEIGGRETEHTYLLWVRDNGVGFDMRYHDRIFEIFQRLHRAEDYPGTGIGLAIVHKVMERMKGRVWAESAPGQGATFFLEFPKEDRRG